MYSVLVASFSKSIRRFLMYRAWPLQFTIVTAGNGCTQITDMFEIARRPKLLLSSFSADFSSLHRMKLPFATIGRVHTMSRRV